MRENSKPFYCSTNENLLNCITISDEENVNDKCKLFVEDHCGTHLYHKKISNGLISQPNTRLSAKALTGELTAAELRRGVKRDKSQYFEHTNDKYFNV
jgi:hypothetical protein